MQCARGHNAVEMTKIACGVIEEKEKKRVEKIPINEIETYGKDSSRLLLLGYEDYEKFPIKYEQYFQCTSCLTVVRETRYRIMERSIRTLNEIYEKWGRNRRLFYAGEPRSRFDFRTYAEILKEMPENEDIETFGLPRFVKIEIVDKVPNHADIQPFYAK